MIKQYLYFYILIFLVFSNVNLFAISNKNFAIVNSNSAKLFQNRLGTSTVSGTINQNEIVFSENGYICFSRRTFVRTSKNKSGYISGRKIKKFDNNGLYLVNVIDNSIKYIPHISGDSQIMLAGDDEYAIMKKYGGKIYKYRVNDGKIVELFSGVKNSINNKILNISPDGRFILFQTGGLMGDNITTRILDSNNHEVINFRNYGGIPIKFSKNGTSILYGPDIYDPNIYIFHPDNFMSNMIDIREKHKNEPPRNPKKPIMVDISEDGSRLLVIEYDYKMTIYKTSDNSKIYGGNNISWGKFLSDNSVFLKRKGGYLLVDKNGLIKSGPVLKYSGNDIPHLSPLKKFVYFTSDEKGKNRLRYIYDFFKNEMTGISDINGEVPLLFNPEFLGNDSKIICSSYIVDPISGIAEKKSLLNNYNGKNLNKNGGYYVSIDKFGNLSVIDVTLNKVICNIPFVRNFTPLFFKNPDYFFMRRNYGK